MASYIYLHPFEHVVVKTKEDLTKKGEYNKVTLGYHSKMGGYTTLMSNMPKSCKIAS